MANKVSIYRFVAALVAVTSWLSFLVMIWLGALGNIKMPYLPLAFMLSLALLAPQQEKKG